MASYKSPLRETVHRLHPDQGVGSRLNSEDDTSESSLRPSTNTKKRKKLNSPPSDKGTYDFIIEKINSMEQNIKELTAIVQLNPNRPPHTTPFGGEGIYDKNTGTIQHQFGALTKQERETFYSIYGKLKELKQNFSKDELNKRLSTEDFNSFKELRNKLSFWVKMGLGASRQLEELNMPIHRTVPKPPLLTTGHMARLFERETDIYLRDMTRIRLTFYYGIFQETKKILAKLNEEITILLTNASTNSHKVVLAKAFRSAVAGSNDLFKINYGGFRQPGTSTEPNTEAPSHPRSNLYTKGRGSTYREVLSMGLRPPPLHTDGDKSLKHPGPTSNDQTVKYTREHDEITRMDMDVEPTIDPHKDLHSVRGPIPSSISIGDRPTPTVSNPTDKPESALASTRTTGRLSLREATKFRTDSPTTLPTTPISTYSKGGTTPTTKPRSTAAEDRPGDEAILNRYLPSSNPINSRRSSDRPPTELCRGEASDSTHYTET